MKTLILTVGLHALFMSFNCIADQPMAWRDCSECPELLTLPSGIFDMGSASGSEEDANTPRRTVNITSFAIGKYEVTQAQWFAIMGTKPSMFKGDDLPVEQVTWKLSKEFCRKLSEKTGQTYRLPSEAEWEYAARAGSTTDMYFGSDTKGISDHAWFDDNSEETTHVAGQKLPNAFGLHDMYGNVWEWTLDCWNTSYAGAPVDGTAWTAGDCSMRVVRGGSWYNKLRSLKSNARTKYSSEIRYNSRGGGLRVVRELPQ
jgi:formylglycine-generating enzyme required for sulfatase activity